MGFRLKYFPGMVGLFHFEVLKNFMEILKYFKTLSLKYFMKFLLFIINWLKTFKNMIKVYEVNRKIIMLFMHNNRYLLLTGLLTKLQWTIQLAPIDHCEIFEIFQKYFVKYFTPKIFMKFYITIYNDWHLAIKLQKSKQKQNILFVTRLRKKL